MTLAEMLKYLKHGVVKMAMITEIRWEKILIIASKTWLPKHSSEVQSLSSDLSQSCHKIKEIEDPREDVISLCPTSNVLKILDHNLSLPNPPMRPRIFNIPYFH